jgi:hypothetical protein
MNVPPTGAGTSCHRGRDRNGRRIRPALCARPPRCRSCDADRAEVARHRAPQAERGSASRFRGLLCAHGRALGPGRSGLLPGAYTGAVSDAELRKVTVDYTIEFARVLRISSPAAAFSFLSGSGADPTGRGRLAFARCKGKAENALLAAGFPRVYIFRPAYIYPVEPRKEPNFGYRPVAQNPPRVSPAIPQSGASSG